MFGIERTDHAEVASVLRFLTAAVLICILCGLLLSIASDGSDADVGDEFTVDGITYKVTKEGGVNEVAVIDADGSLTVYNGVGTVTHGNITYNVTSIGDYAFRMHDALKSVTIPENVTSIGDYAFQLCHYLVSVTIPENVTSIGDGVFGYCSSLVSVTIPENVTSIGDSVFDCCSSLVSVTIPENVTSIGNHSFYECSSLASVTIPENVTSIGDYAFNGCTSLASLTIPRDVLHIGGSAFSDCTGLKELTVPISLDMAVYSSTWDGAVNIEKVTFTPGSGIGYDYGTRFIVAGHYHGHTPWYESKDSLTTVKFEEGITHIGRYILYGCDKISSITITSSVHSIGENAFGESRGLKELTIPITVNAVGNNEEPLFAGCTNLQKVTFTKGTDGYGFNYGIDDSDSLTNYYGFTPWNLSNGSLTEVVFEEGITHIGRYAFSWCTSLTSVTFPSTLKDIDAFAFISCHSLKSIDIPEDIECIGDSSFFGCSSLKSLTVPASVKYIGQYAFYGCTSLETVELPDDVEHVGQNAFGSCPAFRTTNLTSNDDRGVCKA